MNTKKGISLIVLIVTIIVVIILAAVVILTISKNNPIESAKEATFKEDVRAFQDDLTLTVSKEYTDMQGQRDTKINAEGYENIIKYIPSFTKKYDGKFKIVNDELAFIGVDETEIKWCEELSIDILFNAEKWDETATDETCFQWGSDTPGEEGYNVIIGYNSTLANYPKVRIPSRCQKIICDSSYSSTYMDDAATGRSFLNNIQKIEIPSTVIELGDYAFGGTYGNALKSIESITIPNSVTNLGNYAFFGCTSLATITIPNSVTTINVAVFANCSSLTSIIIPNNVTTIGNSTFSGCGQLTSITISDSVTSIGDSAFAACSNLTNITIPNSVTSIKARAFAACSNLTNINFEGTTTEWNSISKFFSWNEQSSIATITCTDGIVTI